MSDDDLGPALRAATHRLVRTVDGLPDESWSGPSLLPGWSRAHVVAHLTLNAEALAACVEGAVSGTAVPMYPSDGSRDDDIADLVDADPADLRERLLGSTTRIADALAQLRHHVLIAASPSGTDLLAGELERTPGGRRFPLGAVADMRLREVEIHHVDLAAGYETARWDPSLSIRVLEAMTARPEALADCVLAPNDDPRRWVLGAGGPVISGPLHALAWWSTGRPAGPDVTTGGDALPRVETL